MLYEYRFRTVKIGEIGNAQIFTTHEISGKFEKIFDIVDWNVARSGTVPISLANGDTINDKVMLWISGAEPKTIYKPILQYIK